MQCELELTPQQWQAVERELGLCLKERRITAAQHALGMKAVRLARPMAPVRWLRKLRGGATRPRIGHTLRSLSAAAR